MTHLIDDERDIEFDPPKLEGLCKHGEKKKCEKCGCTARRDEIHTTEGGRGKIGALRKKGKK